MNLVRAAIWTRHPGDELGEAIDFVTHGNAQHAGFIRGNGLIHENYYPHVRDRAVLAAEKPFIRVFEIQGLTPELSAKLERHFDEYLATGWNYSIADLFRIQFNLPAPADGSGVCSQYVYHHLRMIGLPPLVRCTEDFITPRDLLISPNLVEVARPWG